MACGAPSPAASFDDPAPGETMKVVREMFSQGPAQKYTPTALLHRGSRSVVVRARDHAGSQQVVIKLPPDLPAPPNHKARVQREFSVLRSLRGTAGVVDAIELLPCGGTFALVLQSTPGQPLHRLGAPAGGLGSQLSLAVQMAEILGRIHAAGVVHGDIKPQNFLWDADHAALTLLDFETARHPAEQARTSKSSPPVSWGTPAYMAPEQSGLTSHPVDERSDLYSAGVALYEVFSGRLPFVDGSPSDLIHRHLGATPEPLRAAAPSVPAALSELVMTLLQKDPSQRYQTAAGLAWDLRRCLASLTPQGDIPPFQLRSHDFPDRLVDVAPFVGRHRELGALEQAALRARHGARELALVCGGSGTGKSALLGALRCALGDSPALVLGGKFEQIARATPYLAFRQILEALYQRILSERNAGILRWTSRIEQALGANVSLVTELCPEFALLFGAQRPAHPSGPLEAAHRFKHAMSTFWRTLASEEHPIVLLLDDLHWADGASLRLIETLLSTPGLSHFLVVGSYRTDEPGAECGPPPLRDLLGPAPRSIIHLGPFGAAELTTLVQNALDTSQGNLAELVDVLAEKTAKNPLFLRQFLIEIHRRRWLRRDVHTGEWGWDLPCLRSAPTAPSVAPLLAARLAALGEPLQRLVRVAACLGHRFDERALALAAGVPPDEALLLLDRLAAAGIFARDGGPTSWVFTHDKIQQEAYLLLGPAATKPLHLSIARQLDTSPTFAPIALAQWNHAVDLITDRELQRQLAQRNLEAAAAAERSLALGAALHHAETALALLEKAGGASLQEAEFLRAELLFRLGDVEAAEALFARLLGAATSPETRARLSLRLAWLWASQGEFALAYSTALGGLGELGIEPPGDLPHDDDTALQALSSSLPHDEPPPADLGPEELDLELMLVAWLSCLYSQRSTLAERWSYQLGLASARRPLWRGRGVALAAVGLVLSGRERAAAHAFRIATAGFQHDRRTACLPQAALVYAPVAYFLEGEAATHAMLLDSIQQATSRGDVMAAMFASLLPPMFSATRSPGKILRALWSAVPELRDGPSAQIGRLLAPLELAPTLNQAASCLRATVQRQESRQDEALAAACALVPYALCCGDEETLRSLSGYISAYQPRVLLVALAGLWSSSFLLIRQLEREACPERLRGLEAHVARLAAWGALLHPSYQARLLLLRAEFARWSGRPGEAMRLYDEAIDGALSFDLSFDLALALERAADFYLSAGSSRAARQYLTGAVRAYELWGFPAKASALLGQLDKLPGPLPSALSSRPAGAPATAGLPSADEDPLATISSRPPAPGAHDHDRETLVRLLLLLSDHTSTSNTIEKVLDALLRAAEAHKVVFLAGRDNDWRVRAALAPWSGQGLLGLDEPIEQSPHVSADLVALALRSAEPLVREDPPPAGPSALDSGRAPLRPAALLLPIRCAHATVGLLLFEHHGSAGHFDADRVQRLCWLVSRASTVIEGAISMLSPVQPSSPVAAPGRTAAHSSP